MADAGRPNIFCAWVCAGKKAQTINAQMVLNGTSDEVMTLKIARPPRLFYRPVLIFVGVYIAYILFNLGLGLKSSA